MFIAHRPLENTSGSRNVIIDNAMNEQNHKQTGIKSRGETQRDDHQTGTPISPKAMTTMKKKHMLKGPETDHTDHGAQGEL